MKEKTKTSGDRYNQGKLRWSMLDFEALEDVVRVLEFGASKYERGNWRLGLKHTEIIDSLMRHLHEIMIGNDTDNETGLPHIAHIMCNAMFLSYMMKHKPEFDDRLNKHTSIKEYPLTIEESFNEEDLLTVETTPLTIEQVFQYFSKSKQSQLIEVFTNWNLQNLKDESDSLDSFKYGIEVGIKETLEIIDDLNKKDDVSSYIVSDIQNTM